MNGNGEEKQKVIVICGGGNGAHVMTGLASSRPNVSVRVWTYTKAERWNQALGKDKLFITSKEGNYSSKPALITKDPQAAITGADMILFVVPAFAHGQYLTAMKPYLEKGVALVGLPSAAGFEFAIRGILGEELASACTILAFETLPWACRITKFGRSANIIGCKENLNGSIRIGNHPPRCERPVEFLQSLLGEKPVLTTTGCLLSSTILGGDCVHACLMFGQWAKWDGTPLDEAPLFYQGVDEEAAQLLFDVTEEVVQVAQAIMKQKPGLDLTAIGNIYDWLITTYGDQIKDPTNTYTALRSNTAYNGLRHPMKKTSDNKYVPDYHYRYLREDVPYGILVNKGIALLANVSTPKMDMVLEWTQKALQKEYLVDGELKGKDLKATRCPQRYGLNRLEDII